GGLQDLEQLALVVGLEAVEGQRVLAHDQRGGEERLVAGAQPGPRARSGLHREPDAADAQHDAARAVTGDPTGERRDHERSARAGARQAWQIASARASAASAGLGSSANRRIRVTIRPTWALSARPEPVTAAFTSLGVCSTTG